MSLHGTVEYDKVLVGKVQKFEGGDQKFYYELATKLPKDGSEAMTGNLPMNGHRVTALGDPVEGIDAANKRYVDGILDEAKEHADGLADALGMQVNNVNSLINKVEGNSVSKDGDTMSGNLNMGGKHKVTNLCGPFDNNDAITKGYLELETTQYLKQAKEYADEKVDSLTAEDVGARPDTWLPTIAQLGAASAYYGLGEREASESSVKDAQRNGWYAVQRPQLHPGEVSYMEKVLMRVDSLSEDFYMQTLTLRDESTLQRKGNNNNWEWVNPPMELGVEYCTTERYQRLRVYVVMMELDMVDKGETTFTFPGTPAHIIELSGVAHSETLKHSVAFPAITNSGTIGAALHRTGDHTIRVKTFDDYSGYKAIVKVKYTKYLEEMWDF